MLQNCINSMKNYGNNSFPISKYNKTEHRKCLLEKNPLTFRLVEYSQFKKLKTAKHNLLWCFSDRASWIDYILNTNLMYWLLFIHKNIIFLYMFRASSAHLQEDTVVYMQHMVLSPSTRVRGGLSVHSLSENWLEGEGCWWVS